MKPPIKERIDWDLIKREASDCGLDFLLVGAIVAQESSGDPYAIRSEPTFSYTVTPEKFAKLNNQTVMTELILQKCSIGLMQLMGAIARELGFARSLLELVEPELNVGLGCKKLNLLFHKHDKIEDVIASYNSGSPLHNTDTSYKNQKYVDSVLRLMKDFA